VLQGVEEDGQFALEITLDGLHKAISGQPASGSHSETMDLFFESLGYAWEQGWNAICLPFVSVTHETAEALAGMTVFKLDEGGYVRNGEVPLQTAMWVYCSDPALVPEIQGLGPEKENRGVDQLPVGAWSFHGPLQEARLPSGHTAWEWSASQYRLATDLQPGRAYWIYRFADN